MAGRPEGAEAYLSCTRISCSCSHADSAEVLHNGVPVQNSTWLRSGDVINFGAARCDCSRNVTISASSKSMTAAAAISRAPPIIEPSARLQGGEGDAERIDPLQFRPSGPTKAAPKVSLDPKKIVFGTGRGASWPSCCWFIFTATSVGVPH